MRYFFDSYAVIELLQEAPSYAKYFDEKLILTVLNLIEITYYFLDNFGEGKARIICENLSEDVVNLSNDDIIAAVKFRNENKGGSLSYADCIGYTYAKKNGLLFLTGDDAFKAMRNVEFVK